MGDVVAMLDARQAKEESAARPPFEVYEWGAQLFQTVCPNKSKASRLRGKRRVG
jgi:hypothetical protein